MFAGVTENACGAHVIFYTHEPHFLKSGTKSLHLISKNMNLNKVAILLFGQNLAMFYTQANITKRS